MDALFTVITQGRYGVIRITAIMALSKERHQIEASLLDEALMQADLYLHRYGGGSLLSPLPVWGQASTQAFNGYGA